MPKLVNHDFLKQPLNMLNFLLQLFCKSEVPCVKIALRGKRSINVDAVFTLALYYDLEYRRSY